jgi:mono/diheme cytochrome c family protein
MAFAATKRLRAVPVALFASALLSTVGCGSDSDSGPTELEMEPENPFLPDNPPQAGAGGGPSEGFAGGFAPREIDQRPVIRSSAAPRAIQGGTLAIAPDDSVAVVADGDRDRLLIVDLQQGGVLATLTLDAGAEPGRIAFDGAGRAHVALRGTGEVIALDVASREIVDQRAVCGVPSGLAYDAANDAMIVACQGGELVTLPAAGGETLRSIRVEQDLRDVIVQGERVFVSSFKSAQLLELDAAGAVIERASPTTLTGKYFSPFAGIESADRTLEPAVAWRTVASASGKITMVHQRAQLDDIDIGLPGHDGEASAEDDASPAMMAPSDCFENPDGSFTCSGPSPIAPGFPGGASGGYGAGGGTCTSIVETGITEFGDSGTVRSSPPIVGAIVPVDGALSPDGRYMAIASAGAFEDHTFFVGNSGDGLGVVVVDTMSETPPGECVVPGSPHPGGMIGTGQAVAVAYDSGGALVVQTREPNRLRVYEAGCVGGCSPALDISLGGEARRDTGHDLFHANAGGGLACASCHPGGGDDGRTWHFKNLGPRRTQLFTMGIRGTEPLHWDGDLPTLNHLVGEVFVRRMGGAPQTQARVEAMDEWMNTLQVLPALRAHDDPAALRGKALFESSEVQCTNCHTGEKLTNNKNEDVGTGGAFQVPSLINVAYHQPYIHTGCAKTLHQRFDADCGGGDMHGKTSHLDAEQIDDLVAYLETL